MAGPSEKKSLAEELADSRGRYAPRALRRCAPAVRTSAVGPHHGRLDPLRAADGLGKRDGGCLSGHRSRTRGREHQNGNEETTLHHVFGRRNPVNGVKSKNEGLTIKFQDGTLSAMPPWLAIRPAAKRFPAGSEREPGTQDGQDIGRLPGQGYEQQAEGNEYRADWPEYRAAGVAGHGAEHQRGPAARSPARSDDTSPAPLQGTWWVRTAGRAWLILRGPRTGRLATSRLRATSRRNCASMASARAGSSISTSSS